jgi:hypothetical protein
VTTTMLDDARAAAGHAWAFWRPLCYTSAAAAALCVLIAGLAWLMN